MTCYSELNPGDMLVSHPDFPKRIVIWLRKQSDKHTTCEYVLFRPDGPHIDWWRKSSIDTNPVVEEFYSIVRFVR